ncbi:MAG TPA: S-layer homology domain-containing protein [Candidatus Obscuribacterales bacterium]
MTTPFDDTPATAMTHMMGSNRIIGAIAALLALGGLVGCAGSPLGSTVQQSLEADPQLEESPPFADAEATDAPAPSADPPPAEDIPETAAAPPAAPGDPDFIGPVAIAPAPSARPTVQPSEAEASSLAGIPPDLQPYIRDLQALKVLTLDAAPSEETATPPPSPFGATITRKEYARWLFASHNALYAEEPGQRLRAGNASDQPAFQDVPPTHPDFGAIQGLAEAGIIPSAFTGNSTAVNFRPDAPLVRADLILWKVPLDTRAALPPTTPQAVTESWGFQDVARVDPLALQAIAADFQLGDFSNFRRAFGYTTLFRADKAVTRAEAAAVLWRFGSPTEGRSAADAASRPAATAAEVTPGDDR